MTRTRYLSYTFSFYLNYFKFSDSCLFFRLATSKYLSKMIAYRSNVNTNKTDAVIFGYCELTSHNPARRTFMLDLTWKFNEALSKYRGSGAGDKQKARM